MIYEDNMSLLHVGNSLWFDLVVVKLPFPPPKHTAMGMIHVEHTMTIYEQRPCLKKFFLHINIDGFFL